MATIANLDINLRANTLKYENKMKRAQKVTTDFSRVFKSVAGISTAVVVGINAAVQRFATLGDEIAKTSKQLQVTTGDFQSLVYAIERNGGSQATLETGIKRLSANFFDLERGLSTAKDSFAELNLTQQDLAGLDTADQFRLVVDRLGEIENRSVRAAVAQKVFGRAGLELLPLVDNLKETEDRFRSIGGEVGPQALENAEAIKDANQDLAVAFRRLGEGITNAFAPAILDAMEMLADSFIRVGQWMDTLQDKIIEFRFGYKIQRATAIAVEGSNEFDRAQLRSDRTSRFAEAQAATKNTSGNETAIKQQKELIQSLRATATNLAPLPQVLTKGSSAQIGFLNQLKQQEKQSEIKAREKKKIEVAEKQLKNLEDLLSEQKKQNQLLSGGDEIV